MAWWDNPFLHQMPLPRFGPPTTRWSPGPDLPVRRPVSPVDPRVIVRQPRGRITDPILTRSPQVVGRIDNPFLNYLRRR